MRANLFGWIRMIGSAQPLQECTLALCSTFEQHYSGATPAACPKASTMKLVESLEIMAADIGLDVGEKSESTSESVE